MFTAIFNVCKLIYQNFNSEWMLFIYLFYIVAKSLILTTALFPFPLEHIVPPVRYSTVEIFYGSKPGIRVSGEIDTELMMQLSNSVTGKTIQDDRGW